MAGKAKKAETTVFDQYEADQEAIRVWRAAQDSADTQALVAGVRAHAEKCYEWGGWDILVETWSDEEIVAEMGYATSVAGAIAKVRKVVGLQGSARAEVQATAF
jgi:hypothetical protein